VYADPRIRPHFVAQALKLIARVAGETRAKWDEWLLKTGHVLNAELISPRARGEHFTELYATNLYRRRRLINGYFASARIIYEEQDLNAIKVVLNEKTGETSPVWVICRLRQRESLPSKSRLISGPPAPTAIRQKRLLADLRVPFVTVTRLGQTRRRYNNNLTAKAVDVVASILDCALKRKRDGRDGE